MGFIGFVSLSQAQPLVKNTNYTPTEGYVSAGFMVGTSHYFGDLYTDFIPFTRPMVGVYLSRKLSPHVTGRLNLSMGWMLGDDASAAPDSDIYARNLHFRNMVTEVALVGIYEIFGSYNRHTNRRKFSPYLLGGIALFHHNPQAKIDGEWVGLQPLGTEGQGQPSYDQHYSKVKLAFPLGAGFRYAVNKRLDIGFEIGVRFTNTDYLDDVGGAYPRLDDLSNPLAQTLSNRSLETTAARTGEERDVNALLTNYGAFNYTGDNGVDYSTINGFQEGRARAGSQGRNDIYMFTAFHLSYIIDVGLKCPIEIRR